MEIVKGAIGTVGSYDLEFTTGKLVVSFAATESFFGATMTLNIDSSLLVKAIEAKISNPVVKQVLDLLAAELAAKA